MPSPFLRIPHKIFSRRLLALRRNRGLTQLAMAGRSGLSLSQVHRYEAGLELPSLSVIRQLCVVLRTSADNLIFDVDEGGPITALQDHFETISRLPPREQTLLCGLLDALIARYQIMRPYEATQPDAICESQTVGTAP